MVHHNDKNCRLTITLSGSIRIYCQRGPLLNATAATNVVCSFQLGAYLMPESHERIL